MFFLVSAALPLDSDAKPFVTLVIPTLNSQAHVRRAINSALGQTYIDNMEIVVVDDGSKDKTLKYVKSLSQQNPSIRLVQMDHTKGLLSAHFAGTRWAIGDYIMFLDSDDELISKTIIQHAAEKAISKRADIVHFKTASLVQSAQTQNEPVTYQS